MPLGLPCVTNAVKSLSAISAGMDIYSVAEITGTSIRMIEKHYGKLLKDRVRDAMTAAAVLWH